MKSGAEILVECVERQGVCVVFGMPGSITREIYAALHRRRSGIRHITARHEGGACLMAEGYARATGDVGLCLSVPGPGATNAYTGMLEAYTANVPVVLLTAQHESGYTMRDIKKMTHGLDQECAFKAVTKCMKVVKRVEDIPEAVAAVFETVRSGRPGPALLEISRDALRAEADLEIPERRERIRVSGREDGIKTAAQLLARSKRPFLLLGAGVYHSGASAEALRFGKVLEAPIATSGLGKGVISEDENLSVGYIGHPIAREALQESDLCLAVGTRLVHADTDGWTLEIPRPLIQIDDEASELNHRYPADVSITGDAKLVIQQLLQACERIQVRTTWAEKLPQLRTRLNSWRKPLYLQHLRRVMAKDAIISIDVHRGGYHGCRHFPVYEPGSFLHSHISMGMGYALPAAIGAKVAFPGRQVVAFCGDGGFMLSSPEFSTAVKENIGVVFVILNDRAFGTIKDVQRSHFGRTLGVDVCNPDFVKFAEACGAPAFRVTRSGDFAETMERALGLKRPVIVEVIRKWYSPREVLFAVKKTAGQLWRAYFG